MARPKNTDTPDTSKAIDLTAGAIERLTCPPGKKQDFLRDTKAPGLRVRVTATGAKSFVFEAKLNRQTIRRTIGNVQVWTIEEARKEARELAVMMDRGTDPRQVDKDKADALAAEKQKAEQAAQYTLADLLNDYTAHQKDRGRTSYKDAQSIFDNHVIKAWPKVAALPACEVTDEQFADMMRRLIELGHGRTANKLRTYAAAAYALAKSARTNPAVPLKFKAYGIRMNPAADCAPDASANKADKNPLLLPDLQTYWRSIKGMPGYRGAVLRLHLLTGGQRIEQFVRLLTVNAGPDTITLYDGKGRPTAGTREINLPLIPAAADALAQCRQAGQFAISTTGGAGHLWDSTFGGWSKAAAHGIEEFNPKRLRSGLETLLAKLGFPEEIRGRLQSHGISGVQNRHYNGHDYLDELRKALEAIHRALEGEVDSNVLPFKAAA